MKTIGLWRRDPGLQCFTPNSQADVDRREQAWLSLRVSLRRIAVQARNVRLTASHTPAQLAFPESMRPRYRHPVAREFGEVSVMFKVHPTLSEKDLADTCIAVSKVMQLASRW